MLEKDIWGRRESKIGREKETLTLRFVSIARSVNVNDRVFTHDFYKFRSKVVASLGERDKERAKAIRLVCAL